MMGFTPAELTVIADAERTRLAFVGVNTADPGTTGASEATGASYARQAVVLPAAASGVSTVTVAVPVEAGTYSHFSLWSTATGGAFRYGNTLKKAGVATPAVISPAGTINVTLTLRAENQP